MRDVEN